MSQPDANPPADFTVSLPESWRPKLAQPEPAQPDDPNERIAVIEDSLQCFTYGWLSCLPVIGVAWLYPAVRRFAQARRRQNQWNPARGYLAAGLALASAGWFVMLMSWLVVLNAVVVVGELATPDASVMNLLPAVLFFGCPPAIAGLVVAGATCCPRLTGQLLSYWRKRTVRKLLFGLAVFIGLLTVFSSASEKLWQSVGLRWPELPPETYLAFGPVVSWSLWMAGGMGCLVLRGEVSKRFAWLVGCVWLAGAALLTSQLFKG